MMKQFSVKKWQSILLCILLAFGCLFAWSTSAAFLRRASYFTAGPDSAHLLSVQEDVRDIAGQTEQTTHVSSQHTGTHTALFFTAVLLSLFSLLFFAVSGASSLYRRQTHRAVRDFRIVFIHASDGAK